jgi:pimeloyl-ACP methyl ester carboxylesterase
VVGLALPATWAVLSAWWMPRGPVSTAQSLACLGLGLLVGLGVGWLTGSRWAMLTAPAIFVVVYEIGRWPVDGPTVDGLRLSTYGVIAFVTGRLFHGLVALVPMAWGAAAGAAARRRADAGGWRVPARAGSRLGRRTCATGMVLTGVLLVALTALVARPSSTAPITGPDGRPLPGSVAELTSVDVGDHDLGLMIRGQDRANPVLLFLAGGPGGSELGAMRRHLPALEEHFTVVTWDQRGTGRSYGELDPADTLTLESTVEDTLAVTDYLRERFDQERILLVGQSWGSTLGVLAVQASPERYRAFVGVGQMVSQLATDRIFYDDTLAWAAETGQDDLAARLRDIGPPPYDDVRDYELALSHEMELYPYDHGANSEGAGQMSENLFVREYSLTEQVHVLAGVLDTFAVLYPQLQDIDFRESATSFEVPVFFVQGGHEAPGRADLFDEWYAVVSAPVKDRVVFATSGHRPMFEQPEEFVDYLVDVVVPRS